MATKIVSASKPAISKGEPDFDALSFVRAEYSPRIAWSPKSAAALVQNSVSRSSGYSYSVQDLAYDAGSDIGHRAAVEFASYLVGRVPSSKKDVQDHGELIEIVEAMFDPMDPLLRRKIGGEVISDHWRRGEIQGFLWKLQEIFVGALEAKGNDLLRESRRRKKSRGKARGGRS
jgi:hypothetical protein